MFHHDLMLKQILYKIELFYTSGAVVMHITLPLKTIVRYRKIALVCQPIKLNMNSIYIYMYILCIRKETF